MSDEKTTDVASRAPEELLYRGLFDHALMEVHIWEVVRDEEGKIETWRLVDVNERALTAWGKTKKDVVGRTTDEIFEGAQPTKIFEKIVSELMETGEPVEWEMAFEATGQVLHMVSYPVNDFFVSTGLDVSGLRESEKALTHALESLHQAVQDGGVGLWEWDLRTNETNFSREYYRQLGYEPDELPCTFEMWRERVHPDDIEETLEIVEESIASGYRYQAEFRMLHKDGSHRHILAQATVLRDEDGEPKAMRGSHIDVTEKRRLQKQVHESQKLEAVGTLAAGIAHDFNNILAAMTGNIGLLGDLLSSENECAEIVDDVKDALERATSLTSQLLTFAKGGSPVRETTDLRDFLAETARFMSRGTTVACIVNIDDDLPSVDADLGQLSQVVNNLLINANQATPEGGEVTLRATRRAVGPAHELGLIPGEYVEISVSDEGDGIDPEIRSKIFEPFFSTKEDGSGLGLSTSYAIVQAHGGGILVDAGDGPGTTFRVLLPATDKAESSEDSPESSIAHGSGRVLVMDDNEAVARALSRMLVRLGYECDAVASGDAAVTHYRDRLQTDSPYVAVILDLTIPGEAGGKEVVGELREIDPDVVAIVTSGYADGDVLAEFRSHGFRGRLAKPFDLSELSTTLHAALKG